MVKRLFTMKTTSARFTMHTWKKKGASGLDAATVDVEAVPDLLNGDLRDVGATASRRNERRRRDLARHEGMNRSRYLPGSVWPFRTNEFIRFFVRRIR
jgi:hypothetical protein